MKKELIYNIKIIITDLKVDDHYFSFDYEIDINDDGVGVVSHYESDHAWQDDKDEFLKMLKNGYAVQCILDDFEVGNVIQE